MPSAALFDELHYQGDRDRQYVRGEGCQACFDTGFRGRIGLYAVLKGSRELRDLINKDARGDAIRDWNLANGGTTLLEEGLRRAEEGVTSLDEVLPVARFD